MTMRITRRELVQRGAAGVTILSLPGSSPRAAAAAGAAGAATRSPTCCGSRTGRSTSTSTRRRRRIRRSTSSRSKTGIKVDYFEDINSNAEYFGKIQGPLSQGQSIDRDIIVLTDNERFLGLMIDKGWVEQLDKDLIPNFSNLIDAQTSPPFDPDRKYTLPWQSGMTGIAWNENDHERGHVDHAALRGLRS